MPPAEQQAQGAGAAHERAGDADEAGEWQWSQGDTERDVRERREAFELRRARAAALDAKVEALRAAEELEKSRRDARRQVRFAMRFVLWGSAAQVLVVLGAFRQHFVMNRSSGRLSDETLW